MARGWLSKRNGFGSMVDVSRSVDRTPGESFHIKVLCAWRTHGGGRNRMTGKEVVKTVRTDAVAEFSAMQAEAPTANSTPSAVLP